MHINDEETVNNHGNECRVCGNLGYPKYSTCGVYLHLMANKGQSVGQTCFFDYHNDDFFGLARADAGLSKTKSKDWNYPKLAKKRENASIIN